MSIELKIDLYNSVRSTGDKLMKAVSDIDWYGVPEDIEKIVEERDIEGIVSHLNDCIWELKAERETIRTAEWNEKLSDSLRIFKRFLWKNRKDDSIAKECIDNLEYITMLEM